MLWQLQRGPLLGVEPRPPSELASLQANFVSASFKASLAMLCPRLLVLDAALGKFQPSVPSAELLHAGLGRSSGIAAVDVIGLWRHAVLAVSS